MVFAAGLGTRLRPYTNDRPKALVTVNGMSLLEIQIRRLARFGAQRIVVNVHHFADLVEAEVEQLRGIGPELCISDERDFLLETGGGLKKAAELLQGSSPILVVNVDILTTLDLHRLVQELERKDALAAMAVRDRETSRYLVWDQDLKLCGWENRKTGATRGQIPVNAQSLAFSGIHAIRPEFLDLMAQKGKFSIIDTYLDLAPQHHIIGLRHDEDLWLDVGKPHNLELANTDSYDRKVLK